MHSPISDCLGLESSDFRSASALAQPEKSSGDEFKLDHEDFPELRLSNPLPLTALLRTTRDAEFTLHRPTSRERARRNANGDFRLPSANLS